MMMGPAISAARLMAGGASSPYGSHLYWRLFVTANNGGASLTTVSEVQFRATPGGANLASGGTALKSNDSVGNEASKAFDGDISTAWAATGTTNQWIGYQFASPVSVAEIAIGNDNTSTDPVGRAPKSCKLEYSDDGSIWTEAFSFIEYGPICGGLRAYPEAAPAAGYHRFWRVYCLNNNGGSSLILLDEVQFRATAGGADQTVAQDGVKADRGYAGGRGIASGTTGWQAFSNESSNSWSGPGTTNQWVGYVFPDPVKVEEVALTATTNTSRAPNDIRIEYSDDLVSWTSQKAINDLTWSASETKVLSAL